MRIAIGQVNTTAGDVRGNLRKLKSVVARAGDEGAELLVLPELAIPGYGAQDLVRQTEFVLQCQSATRELAESAGGLSVLVGTLSVAEPGEEVFNCASLLQNGEVVSNHCKTELPAFPAFNEAHYFARGRGFTRMEAGGLTLGVTISDELWDSKLLRSGSDLRAQAIESLKATNIDMLINLAAAPFRVGHGRARRDALSRAAETLQVPTVFANVVGGNDSVVFDGGSLALDAQGGVIGAGEQFEEDLVLVDTAEEAQSAPAEKSQSIEKLRRALVLALRDYARKSGFESAVLGLSGGIDSSVVACLAADALGADKVTALMMPSEVSRPESTEDAEKLAEVSGIRYHTLSIEQVRQAFERTLEPLLKGTEPDTTEENIQARARGVLVMACANKFGHLALATGNRSELAVGYCTLYGDMVGGIGVLGDVPKTTVYELAEHINRDGRVIPQSIIDKVPSAELRPDQTDQDELPPYEELDGLLEGYLDRHKGFHELTEAGADREVVADVVSRILRSEFKRRQGPVVPRVMSAGSAFPVAGGSRGFLNSHAGGMQ